MTTKNTTQHTAGPWEVYGYDYDNRRAIVQAVRPYPNSVTVATVQAETVFKDELHANAALIAAAPELLAFAKRMSSYFEANPNGYDDMRAEAQAVIAKATGDTEGGRL